MHIYFLFIKYFIHDRNKKNLLFQKKSYTHNTKRGGGGRGEEEKCNYLNCIFIAN